MGVELKAQDFTKKDTMGPKKKTTSIPKFPFKIIHIHSNFIQKSYLKTNLRS
jgi:hypothetical protein